MSTTLTQIAQASNVSVGLVSRLMRNDPKLRVTDETRQRVLAAKSRLEAEAASRAAASSDRSRRTFMAALRADFKHGQPHRSDYFHLYRLVQAIEAELTDLGHMLALSYYPDGEGEKQAEQVADAGYPVDGVVYLWGRVARPAQKILLEHRAPHLVFHPSGDYQRLQTIRPLKEESFRALVNHLVELGHERIGYVGCRDRRYPWFASAMIYANLPLDPGGLCPLDSDGPMPLWGDWRGAAYKAFGPWLDAHPGWTAVVTENDFAALGVVDALEARGLKVGRDLSVASYGNAEPSLGGEGPAILTTIDEQVPQIARRIVSRLLEQLDRPPTTGVHELVPGELVIRESTGAPS